MELQTLQKQLAQELNMDGTQIIHQMNFCVPIHTLQATYNPVLKKPMDILMKMLLKAFQTGVFKDGNTIADVLLVEPLFVNDLLHTMQKSGLLQFEEVYSLTPKGEQQLAEGVYEEQLESVTDLLHYSPLHGEFLAGDVEDVLDFEDFPEEVLEAPQEITILEQTLIDALNDRQEEEAERQAFVTDIEDYEEIQINDIPCVAFICYDKKADRLFARVYNTLLNEWDPKIEDILHERQRAEWRTLYLA